MNERRLNKAKADRRVADMQMGMSGIYASFQSVCIGHCFCSKDMRASYRNRTSHWLTRVLLINNLKGHYLVVPLEDCKHGIYTRQNRHFDSTILYRFGATNVDKIK